MKYLLSGLSLLLGVGMLSCSPSSPDTPADAVRIRWARDPDNLDPLVVDNLSSFETINLLHCSLLKGTEATGDFVPWLAAAKPTVQPLGDSLLRVSYRLRAEATWDNGTPILARDVAFTLKVMNCPGLPIELDQATYGFIRNIELDPQDTRRFTLVCAGQSADRVRISGDFAILPEHILDSTGVLRSITLPSLRTAAGNTAAVRSFARRYQARELARHPERLPGCGPYLVTAWQPGRYLTLQRKTKWWADALPSPPPELQAFPGRLTFQVIPDAATATLALRRGEIDLFPLMPAPEFSRLRQSAPDSGRLRFYTADSYESVAATFNVRKPALQDPLTRQALSHLFNVPLLIQATQQGAALPSVGLISPRVRQYYNDSLPLLPFSPDRAAQLLQQAGWRKTPTGTWRRGSAQQLQLGLSYRTGEPSFETVARQFQAAATEVGIPVRLLPTEPSVLLQQLRAGTVDMSIRVLSGNPFSYDFTPLLHSQGLGVGNFTGFTTPASDHLIDAITATSSGAEKTRLLRKFQRLMAYERPFSVLYFLQYRVAAARRLGPIPVSGLKPGYEAARIHPRPAAVSR